MWFFLKFVTIVISKSFISENNNCLLKIQKLCYVITQRIESDTRLEILHRIEYCWVVWIVF